MRPFISSVQRLNLSQPFDLRHAIPAWKDDAKRKTVLGSQRLTVQSESQDGIRIHRILHEHASTVRRLHSCRPLPLDIKAEKHDLARFGFDTALRQDRSQT